MKHINKICAFAGLVLVLGTGSLQASFDNTVNRVQQNSYALLSDQGGDSMNPNDNQTPNSRFTSPGNNPPLTPRSPALVPEPTTMIAGALLLVPFAVSAVRISRRNQSSQAK